MFKMFKIITMSETQYMQYILAMFKMPTIFQMITMFQMLKMFKTHMLLIRHDVQQAQNLQNAQDVQTANDVLQARDDQGWPCDAPLHTSNKIGIEEASNNLYTFLIYTLVQSNNRFQIE